jgi:hypothetical protein
MRNPVRRGDGVASAVGWRVVQFDFQCGSKRKIRSVI